MPKCFKNSVLWLEYVVIQIRGHQAAAVLGLGSIKSGHVRGEVKGDLSLQPKTTKPPYPPPPPFKASSITNRINNNSIKAALYSLLLLTNIHKKYMSRFHNIPRSAHTNTPNRYHRTGFSLQSLVLRNAQRLTFHVTLRTEVFDLPR